MLHDTKHRCTVPVEGSSTPCYSSLKYVAFVRAGDALPARCAQPRTCTPETVHVHQEVFLLAVTLCLMDASKLGQTCPYWQGATDI